MNTDITAITANLRHAAQNHETLTIGGGDFGPDELRQAAHLIAAAPEMLEALADFAEAMRWANDTPHLIDNTHALQLAVNRARAILDGVAAE